MLSLIDKKKILQVVSDTIITIPGFSSFFNLYSFKNKKYSTNIDLEECIKLNFIREKHICEITIYLVLFKLVNIYNICQEIQIRIKHEVEKLNLIGIIFKVNIVIKDLI